MKLLLCLTFVVLSVCSASAVDYDAIVDKILDGIKGELVKESKTTIPLSNYTQHFSTNIWFIPFEGTVKFSGVSMGDFSTLRRFGSIDPSEVYGNLTSGRLSILATFSMDQLLLTFDEFKMDFLLLHVDTPVDVKIESNRFSLMVFVNLNETTKQCQTSLGFGNVDHLGDFQVVLGDSGFFSPSVERVDDIVLDWLVPEIQDAVGNHVRSISTHIVQEWSQEICSGFFKGIKI